MTGKSFWSCPVCRQWLDRTHNSLVCANGHRFDLAKQGYANLLLANQKKSRLPGDTAGMMAARRSFLQSGSYDFLFDALKLQVCQMAVPSSFTLLDIGCGEGSYLSALWASCQFNDAFLAGIDISKFAVKRASSLLRTAQFAVASNFYIPVISGTVDLVLAVFAPIDSAEVARVLKPNGVLIRVSPGENHLMQLKQKIYHRAEFHQVPKCLDNFDVVSRINICDNKILPQLQLANLIGMTPLGWRGNKSFKERLMRLDELEIDFDFLMEVMCVSR